MALNNLLWSYLRFEYSGVLNNCPHSIGNLFKKNFPTSLLLFQLYFLLILPMFGSHFLLNIYLNSNSFAIIYEGIWCFIIR